MENKFKPRIIQLISGEQKPGISNEIDVIFLEMKLNVHNLNNRIRLLDTLEPLNDDERGRLREYLKYLVDINFKLFELNKK